METTAITKTANVDVLEPMGTVLPADRHPVAVYVAGLGAGSRRTMAQALGVAAGMISSRRCSAFTLPWQAIRYQHVAALRSALQDRYAPATANKILAAVRGVVREAFRLGYVSAEELARVEDVKAIKATRLPKGRQVEDGDLLSMFRSCSVDGDALGARDAALLGVLFGAGLRRAEAVALNVGDYDRETGGLVVRAGKGRKDRRVFMTNGAKAALEDWIDVRGDVSPSDPLLCAIRKGGKIENDHRLNPQAIYVSLRRRAARAGVNAPSPHDGRRTFASNMLEAGADLVAVQALMGHANPSTTARYDRRGDESRRKAAGLLRVPYVPRRKTTA